MRNISAVSLAKLREQYGNEPFNFVSVSWVTNNLPLLGEINTHYYADKNYETSGIVLEGRLLDIGGIDDIIKVSDSGKTQSVSIKLSDTDGVLKNIFDYNDIHKKKVLIWQSFTSIPIGDSFIIFQGEINSSINWVEGDRTLTFEVIEQVEDVEVGFSPEEAQIPIVPFEMIGKAWPLGFGSNIRVPVLKINEPPVGVTRHPISFPDPSLLQKIHQNTSKRNALYQIMYLDLLFAGAAAISALVTKQQIKLLEGALNTTIGINEILSGMQTLNSQMGTFSESFAGNVSLASSAPGIVTLNGAPSPDAYSPSYDVSGFVSEAGSDFNTISSGISGNTSLVDGPIDPASIQSSISNLQGMLKTYEGTQKQYEDAAAQIAAQIGQINADNDKLEEELNNQGSVGKVTSIIKGEDFPRGGITIKVGEAILNGHFVGDTFYPDGEPLNPIDPRDPNEVPNIDEQVTKGKYYVINPGTTVKLYSNYDIYYVVNLLGSVIHEVVAKRSVDGGAAVLVTVPPSYYTIENFPFTDETSEVVYNVTMLHFFKDLSCYDEGWENEVLVSYTSEIGPNTIDIMKWLINTYSQLDWDGGTFDYVRSKINQFPSNFVLNDRKNLITLLEEICFQSRIALWLDLDVFKVRYLPEEPTPVDEITVDDIEFNSIEISGTRTEDIVTKMVGKYKFNFEDKEPNEIVLRFNIKKYKTQQQEYDYYIYNSSDAVYQSMSFWLIRKSNTWKIIKLKTFLNKLNLETFDPVTLDIRYLSDVPIVGIIQSATYNSGDQTIEFEIWVPVRLGEMVPYDFSYPANLSPFVHFPNNEEIEDGSVGGGINKGVSGQIPEGGGIKVDNSISSMPGRASNRPRDYGPTNVSDNKQGEIFQINEFEPGTVLESSAPGIVRLYERNTGNTNFRPGQMVSLGRYGNTSVTDVLGSEVSANGNYRITTIQVGASVTGMIPGTPVLSRFSGGPLGGPISSAQPYNFRDYAVPGVGAIPPYTNPTSLSRSGGGGGTPIMITGGTGKTYSAIAYPRGLTNSSINVSVSILQLDDSETIPTGTWLIATKIGEVYYAQPPIWLGTE